MKAIILAAGEGTRLRPLTLDCPKCMVKYYNKPIISYILKTIQQCGIEDITIVNGYKKEILCEYLRDTKVKYYTNNDYATTNMVHTLFCAEKEMDDDIIISYADIIYSKSILESLIEIKADISVVVDGNWERLWKIRMNNPLDDAETMKITQAGDIIELGKKPKDLEEIQGQYMGLIKISKQALIKVKDFYISLDRSIKYDGKNFNNMYMTSFIQKIIDKLMPVKAVITNDLWIEIDSLDDINNYRKHDLKFS